MTWMELFSTARDGRVIIKLPIHVHPMSNNCWPYILWDFVSTTMIQFKLKCYYNFPIFFFLFLSCAVIPLPISLFHCFHSLQFFYRIAFISVFRLFYILHKNWTICVYHIQFTNWQFEYIQHYYYYFYYILLKFSMYKKRYPTHRNYMSYVLHKIVRSTYSISIKLSYKKESLDAL